MHELTIQMESELTELFLHKPWRLSAAWYKEIKTNRLVFQVHFIQLYGVIDLRRPRKKFVVSHFSFVGPFNVVFVM